MVQFICIQTMAHRLDNPSLFIAYPASRSVARIDIPYKVPKEVNNEDPHQILANTQCNFSPDNYEVFYLA